MTHPATLNRMKREIDLLATDPPHGVSAWPVNDDLMTLEAQITGPDGTPYEGGTFLLEMTVPNRYPFEPPRVRFVTPVFHPNIDNGGRICLDSLKQKPAGSWSPSINFGTLLSQIRLLLENPNPDDGLMPDITDLYLRQPGVFREKAVKATRAHATGRRQGEDDTIEEGCVDKRTEDSGDGAAEQPSAKRSRDVDLESSSKRQHIEVETKST